MSTPNGAQTELLKTAREHAAHICRQLGFPHADETKCLSGLATYLEAYVIRPAAAEHERLIAGLVEAIKNSLDTDDYPCPDCEGEGRVYGDGKRHYFFERVATIACARCSGTGTLPTSRADVLKTALTLEVLAIAARVRQREARAASDLLEQRT